MPEVRLIDSETLKSRIGELCTNNEEMFPVNAYKRIIGVIEATPTIEAEPVRHGRWVVNDRNPDYADCTNCGLSEWLGANGSRDYAKTLLPGFKKFCPSCGARMDEPPESEVQNNENL